MLHSITQKDHNWLYISWNRNHNVDNVTEYKVEYSYAGECDGISQDSTVQTTGGANSSYNITGLGAYLNYSITLVAINYTGRSPPNTVFARTSSTGIYGVVVVYVNTYSYQC